MIVVVGGTGFIGTAIVRELAGRGERVVVMSHAATAPAMRLRESTIEVRQGDVRDRPALARALVGVLLGFLSDHARSKALDDIGEVRQAREIMERYLSSESAG